MRLFLLAGLIALLAAGIVCGRPAPVMPTISEMHRSESDPRVFLDRADVLHKESTDSFMIISGNVQFTKGAMVMFCDSAHFYPATESFNAFGNVRMEQGDTLFIYADSAVYDNPSQIANLYAFPGNIVRMINRDVTLETEEFTYDLAIGIGYYDVGGVLFDSHNRLVSREGEYIPATKDANFYNDVVLVGRGNNDTVIIYSDSLFYNTVTKMAHLTSPGEIINKRGTIYTRDGYYDTERDTAVLFDHSLIVTPEGRTLTADTIFYDRTAGRGECFGNMLMIDSARKASVFADYGFFYDPIDSAYATGRLLIKEYANEDTLYLHAKQLNIQRVITTTEIEAVPADTVLGTPDVPASVRYDTTQVADIWPRVRFYRSDMQGICDSMRFTAADSMMRMYINPIIWSSERQVHGKIIEFHVNDSTIEFARLPERGFVAERLTGDYYNQMSGKQLTAIFEAGELRQIDINGNVEFITYPEEADTTINKQVNATSSFMTVRLNGNTTEYVKLWPETQGKVTPLFLLRRSMLFLPKFKWFEGIRPLSPADVMIVPKAMEDLMTAEDG